ncbi:hypothetical protein D3C78_774300 [compost metagenome]
MAQVAAEEGQQGTQVGDGLLHPFGVARHALALQLAQALDARLDAGDAVGHHDDGGFADRQGEMVAADLAVHLDLAEQVDQRVDLAVAQQIEGVSLGGGQHRVEVAGAAVLMDGLRVAALLQQPGRCPLVQLQQQLRVALLQALVEDLAQHPVVAVFHTRAGALLDEQVAALRLANQPLGILPLAEQVGQRRVEGLHHRRPLEEGQQLLWKAGEHFLGKKIGHIGIGLTGHAAQQFGLRAGWGLLAVGGEPEQQAGDPALAAGAQLVERIGVQLGTAATGQLADLLAVHGQLASIDDGQTLVAAQVVEGQFRRALAGRQYLQARWAEAQQLVDITTRALDTQQVQVVEDQGEALALLLQALQDGDPEAGLVGRHQRLLGGGQAQGAAQMQQQVQRLVVGLVQAIPGPGRAQARGVLGEEGALAVAQRRAEQDQTAAAAGGFLQMLQQARAGQDLVRQWQRAELTGVD